MLDYAQPLDPRGMVRQQAEAYKPPSGLPCCSLVAMWALSVIGRFPVDPGIVDLGAWARLDRGWWERANIWDQQDCWSSVVAHQELLGGRLRLDKSGSDAPPLTPGRWHTVQDWQHGYGQGHTFIAYAYSDGSWRCVQSSTSRGYRDTAERGWPRKPGRMVGVLTLPNL